jgi:hypothetical protein
MEWFGTTQYRGEPAQKEIKERFRTCGEVWCGGRPEERQKKNAKKYVYVFFFFVGETNKLVSLYLLWIHLA